jgi:hypothetical protein
MTPNEYIAAELRQFAREFIQNRTKDIVKRDLRNTESLLRSLYAKVQAQPQQGIAFMTVFFNTYGRYQDMRRRYVRPGGTEMEQALKEWAEKEGIGKFRKGRYSGVYATMPQQHILNAIAWGIIRKYKFQGTARKKGWWNKGKERDITNFYEHLLRGYQEAILLEAKSLVEKP